MAATSPSVAVLVESRYLAQRQPAGLVAALARRGAAPLVLDPAAPYAPGALAGARVAVARGRSAALLAALEALERRGLPTVNRASAIRAVLDKGHLAAALAAAGLPTPRTVVVPADRLDLAREAGPFPLVLKPVRGDNARGVVLVRDRAALAALAWPEPLALAQPFVPGDGRDLKLYAAGEAVWAARKASPLHDPGWRSAPALPAPLSPRLRELALACGRLFGLELYGVDCVLGSAGPVVIEVNDFPNYSGIAGADAQLAALVLARAGEPGGRAELAR